MTLGMDVGLGSGHIVLDGDPALPPPKKRYRAPNFRPMSVDKISTNGASRSPSVIAELLVLAESNHIKLKRT